MIGVVLCGGESKRMGSDKALLSHADNTWAEIAFAKMQQLQMPVYVSVNQKQSDFFSNLFSSNNIVVDSANLDIGGPLLGLLSVHQIYPTEDILLLACDMPNMTIEVLAHLKSAGKNKRFEAIVFNNNNQLEPLCAIYSAKGLQKIMTLLQNNNLSKHSLHFALEHLQTLKIDLPDTWQAYFVNCNSKSDLNNLHIQTT